MESALLFQDFEGDVLAPVGQRVARFLCVQSRDDTTQELNPCLFWLLTGDGTWHRFFLDRLGVLHWRTHPALDEQDTEDEDFPVLDIGVTHDLNSVTIARVFVQQREGTNETVLAIVFGDGRSVVVTHTSDMGQHYEDEKTRFIVA